MFPAVFTRAASQDFTSAVVLNMQHTHPACAVRPQSFQESRLTFWNPTLAMRCSLHVQGLLLRKRHVLILQILTFSSYRSSACKYQICLFWGCVVFKCLILKIAVCQKKNIMLIFSWDWGRIPQAPESNWNMLPTLPTAEVRKAARAEVRSRTWKYW